MSCALESQWTAMFRRKDERAIRAIQTALHCCGFNSPHDRAWPFPSRGVDAHACEVALGYDRRCVDPWRRHEVRVAVMVGVASLVNWLLAHLVDMALRADRDPDRDRGRRGTSTGIGVYSRLQHAGVSEPAQPGNDRLRLLRAVDEEVDGEAGEDVDRYGDGDHDEEGGDGQSGRGKSGQGRARGPQSYSGTE
ncbi:hypothetical protein A1O3_10394 [Capronia epimyces CBS 606.96]|uniref:Uncharacterized protein n=1 Tax=Capronia epimyces CBS 606.96 TaxID=1182542 RepID=W9XJT9_9EURO|nr:uncharacterized protein A1O3_10394 [Capronia epimyces CBS 606.96]EXJ77236.1 hypothetical protein A1O3_10394 [Capronia epimyces CBS 606.96]